MRSEKTDIIYGEGGGAVVDTLWPVSAQKKEGVRFRSTCVHRYVLRLMLMRKLTSWHLFIGSESFSPPRKPDVHLDKT